MGFYMFMVRVTDISTTSWDDPLQEMLEEVAYSFMHHMKGSWEIESLDSDSRTVTLVLTRGWDLETARAMIMRRSVTWQNPYEGIAVCAIFRRKSPDGNVLSEVDQIFFGLGAE